MIDLVMLREREIAPSGIERYVSRAYLYRRGSTVYCVQAWRTADSIQTLIRVISRAALVGLEITKSHVEMYKLGQVRNKKVRNGMSVWSRPILARHSSSTPMLDADLV